MVVLEENIETIYFVIMSGEKNVGKSGLYEAIPPVLITK